MHLHKFQIKFYMNSKQKYTSSRFMIGNLIVAIRKIQFGIVNAEKEKRANRQNT